MGEVAYAEQLELVFRQYQTSHDLEVAFARVNVPTNMREKLRNDPDLKARIQVCDSDLRDNIIVGIRDLAGVGGNDGVRLSALKELGRIFYPRKFGDAGEPLPEQAPLTDEEVINDKTKRLTALRTMAYRRLFDFLGAPAASTSVQREQSKVALAVLQGTGELVARADIGGKIDLGEVVEGIIGKIGEKLEHGN